MGHVSLKSSSQDGRPEPIADILFGSIAAHCYVLTEMVNIVKSELLNCVITELRNYVITELRNNATAT